MFDMKKEIYRMVQHGKIEKVDDLEEVAPEDRKNYLYIGIGGVGVNTVSRLKDVILSQKHISFDDSFFIPQGNEKNNL